MLALTPVDMRKLIQERKNRYGSEVDMAEFAKMNKYPLSALDIKRLERRAYAAQKKLAFYADMLDFELTFRRKRGEIPISR